MKNNSSVINSSEKQTKVLQKTLMIIGFTLLTAAAAQVKLPIPGTPVPLTLQTVVVFLSGLVLGQYAGLAAQSFYVGLGALGLPFFAGSGPTDGYLLGFIACAFVVGKMKPWIEDSFLKTWFGILVGSSLVFLLGVSGLKVLTTMSWSQAMALGLYPFVLGDLIKVTIAASIFHGVKIGLNSFKK